MQNSVLTTKLSLTCHSSATRQCQTSFWVVLYFSYVGWWLAGREGGKIVEIDQSCFLRWKCNCSGLCVRAWVFVDIERELWTPVWNPSLFALPRHYSPSLRCVSNVVPQLSVTVRGTTLVSSMKDSHSTLLIAPSFLWRTDAHTYMVKATWKHINIHFWPYWENKIKCVVESRFLCQLNFMMFQNEM
jgi:hypothetical protein